jgi:hypothetical protein
MFVRDHSEERVRSFKERTTQHGGQEKGKKQQKIALNAFC